MFKKTIPLIILLFTLIQIANPQFSDNFSKYDNNLYALYKFNNGTLNDYSGNNRHGELGGNTSYIENGYFLGAYEFDGDKDYIKIGNDTEFADLCINGCTISAWFKQNNPTVNNIYTIVARYGLLNDRFFVFSRTHKWGRIIGKFQLRETGEQYFGGKCGADTGSYNMNKTNKWYNMIGVYNLTNIYIYINGELMESEMSNTDCSGWTINQSAWNRNEDTFIGMRDSNYLLYSMDGKIDEVALWNRILNKSEIQGIASLKSISRF